MHHSKFSQNPVIIVGMHRSGTTVLSKVLQNQGIFLGARKDTNNESTFFKRLNETILLEHGATWDNPGPFIEIHNNVLFKKITLNFLLERLFSKLSIEYLGLRYCSKKLGNRTWGWKDPRNVLTLAYWLELFPKAKIIHIERNAFDVSLSLRNRSISLFKKYFDNQFPFGKVNRLLSKSYCGGLRPLKIDYGLKLWIDYKLHWDKFSKSNAINPTNYFSTKFEDLNCPNGEVELVRLFDFLNLKPTVHPKTILKQFDFSKSYFFRHDFVNNTIFQKYQDRFDEYGYIQN